METPAPPLLAVNSASGSFTAAACEEVRDALVSEGGESGRIVDCQDGALPGRARLEAEGIGHVAVLAGDGTISDYLGQLEREGWQGAALPLPGGTKNLLCRAMFGDLAARQIASLFARGELSRTRRACMRCDRHTALAEVLVGPGARWADVREDVRTREMGEVVSKSLEITREAASGALVRLAEPRAGREEGYPGLHFALAGDGAITARGYRMENLGDWIRQGWAMATMDFREGPYDELGTVERARCEATKGDSLDLMVDGERREAAGAVTITREPFDLDLMGLAA